MFGIDIFEASLVAAMLISLGAGVLSFLSPCVLPIVPPYLAYMAGAAQVTEAGRKRRDVLIAALFFVLGLSTVFVLLGAAASMAGRALLQYQHYFGPISGGIVTLFGLHFLGIIRIPFLFREARLDAGDQGGTPLGAYILGLAFAFGWTPCIGPILSALLAMVAQEASLAKGMVLMASYAVGLGLPFLIAAYYIDVMSGAMAGLKRNMGLIEKIMGALLIVFGILLMTGGFTQLSFWLLETFPVLANFG